MRQVIKKVLALLPIVTIVLKALDEGLELLEQKPQTPVETPGQLN